MIPLFYQTTTIHGTSRKLLNMKYTKAQSVYIESAVFGCLIQCLRERLCIDQVELLTSAGVSQGTWSRIEHGKTNISLDKVLSIPRFLGCEPSSLLSSCEKVLNLMEIVEFAHPLFRPSLKILCHNELVHLT